ncbi:protein NDR1-like protein [Carex littledalei]|uniref:Protein NDR1-like protein n=1 Tax=Carex littledalei TaxID=544730 RepID=A0A833R128_9POAL|nr:protein NDR1-like protein [Carex littledalei]
MQSTSNVYYDPINVAFYDGPDQKHPIANFTIPEFYQRERSTVDYSGMVNATGFDFDGAKQEISANGFKVFRVGLETSVRYDFYGFWKTRRPSQKHSIAKLIIPEFYQGEDSTINYSGMMNATGFDLDGAKQEISANRFRVFRVGLETSVRYDFYWFRKTRRLTGEN